MLCLRRHPRLRERLVWICDEQTVQTLRKNAARPLRVKGQRKSEAYEAIMFGVLHPRRDPRHHNLSIVIP